MYKMLDILEIAREKAGGWGNLGELVAEKTGKPSLTRHHMAQRTMMWKVNGIPIYAIETIAEITGIPEDDIVKTSYEWKKEVNQEKKNERLKQRMLTVE